MPAGVGGRHAHKDDEGLLTDICKGPGASTRQLVGGMAGAGSQATLSWTCLPNLWAGWAQRRQQVSRGDKRARPACQCRHPSA